MENDDLTLPGDLTGDPESAEGLPAELSADGATDLGAAPINDMSADLSADMSADLALDGDLPDLGGGDPLEPQTVDMTMDLGADELPTGGLTPDLGMDALNPGMDIGASLPDMMSMEPEIAELPSADPQIDGLAVPAAAAAAAVSPGPFSGLAADSIVNIGAIHSIKVTVQAVLGGVSLPISKLMSLKKDDVVALDSKIGSAIDLLANGQLIARGEIVVLEEEEEPRFGITLTEIVSGGKS